MRSIFGGGDAGGAPPGDAAAGDVKSGARDGAGSDAAKATDGAKSADAGHDAGSASHDASSHVDSSGGRDGGAKDTGSASCTVVAVPTSTAGLGACAAPVSGTCGPGSLAGFVPEPVPPTGAAQGLCSPSQLQSLFNGCLGPSATDATCTTAANAAMACYNCAFTDQGAAEWGPLVMSLDGIATVNTGGCLELLEPCNSACAATFEEDLECEQAACASNCPVSDSASLMAYSNCANTIDDCAPNGCATYSVGNVCSDNLIGAGHPGAVCFQNAGDFEAQFLAVGAIFCGN